MKETITEEEMSAVAHLEGHGVASQVAVRENAVILGIRKAAEAGAACGGLDTILLAGAEGVGAHAVNCWIGKKRVNKSDRWGVIPFRLLAHSIEQ